ncbi:MAG: CopG family transcriptional regulator [Kiloniellales bacterium]|nr:CopG family transcriptional regulator [Kiloniellales bacterium]
MKPRLCVYLSDQVDQRLAAAARRPGASKSAITDAALAAFLSPERDDQRDAAIIRRLDRLSRQFDRLERDQTILSETLALFVRYYLTITPPLPGAEQDAARALGKERFEYFVAQVGRRLAGGRSMIRDVLEEISADESDFFTQEEVDALRAVKETTSHAKDTANGGGHG